MADPYDDALQALLRILGDPEASKALVEAAKSIDAKAKEDYAARMTVLQREQKIATDAHVEAERLRAASRDELAQAAQERRNTQLLLDQIANREAEVGHRMDAAARADDAIEVRRMELSIRERTLEERETNVSATERRLASAQSDLNRRLDAIRAAASNEGA